MLKYLNVNTISESDINDTILSLREGNLIVCPADTMYGLTCISNSEKAVGRLRKLKGSVENKPFIHLVADVSQVEDLAVIPLNYHTMLKRAWPGPLTVVLEAKKHLPAILNNTIAVRVTANEIARKLILAMQAPMISTSINISGKIPVNDINGIKDVFVHLEEVSYIKYIYEDPNLKLGEPSTLVDLTGAKPKLLREGAISFKELLKFV